MGNIQRPWSAPTGGCSVHHGFWDFRPVVLPVSLLFAFEACEPSTRKLIDRRNPNCLTNVLPLSSSMKSGIWKKNIPDCKHSIHTQRECMSKSRQNLPIRLWIDVTLSKYILVRCQSELNFVMVCVFAPQTHTKAFRCYRVTTSTNAFLKNYY